MICIWRWLYDLLQEWFAYDVDYMIYYKIDLHMTLIIWSITGMICIWRWLYDILQDWFAYDVDYMIYYRNDLHMTLKPTEDGSLALDIRSKKDILISNGMAGNEVGIQPWKWI